MINLNRDICIGCGSCESSCPFGCVHIENDLPVFSDMCTSCGSCTEACPVGALSIPRKEVQIDVNDYKDVWVVLEIDKSRNQLRKASLELLSEARVLADHLGQHVGAIMICSEIPKKCEEQLQEVGCETLYLVCNKELAHYHTEKYANIVATLSNRYCPAVILFSATENGRDLAPRVSCTLQVGLTADCTDLDIDEKNNLVQIRPTFGGNIMASIISPNHRPQMASVRPNVLTVCPSEKQYPLDIIREDIAPDKGNSTAVLESVEEKVVAYKDVAEANIVVVAGYGVGSKENYKKIERFAIRINAAIGATRKVVDEGWASAEIQVGQTGKTIAPDLYIACGVSGALQHSIGIKNAKYKVAINTDPAAPLFQIADVAILGDCMEVIEKLDELITK